MAISVEKNPNLINFLKSDKFSGSYAVNEDMKKHTSYKIGGPASVWCECECLDDIKGLIQTCHRAYIEWTIIGSGTNVLVNDKGFYGVVIHLGKNFHDFEYDDAESVYKVGCATSLSKVVKDAYEKGRRGLEFGVGIPGTVGGAIKMNAGTVLGSIQNSIRCIEYLREDGEVKRKYVNEIDWEYRNCILPNGCIILHAEINAPKISDPVQVEGMRNKMDKMRDKRQKSQPMGKPSCGSVFKNPKNNFAGKLVDEAGLRNFKKGGARVAEEHANFILNDGEASARDVITLMKLMQNRVYDNSGVRLHPEVQFLGFEAFPLSF